MRNSIHRISDSCTLSVRSYGYDKMSTEPSHLQAALASWLIGDLDQRQSQHLLAGAVSLLQRLNHVAAFHLIAVFGAYRLVQIRVERSASRVNRFDLVLLRKVANLR